MSQLYAMTKQMLELSAMLDTDDEVLKQAIQDTMQGVEGEFGNKADAIVMLRRNIEGDVLAIESELERLAELKRVKNNSIKGLTDYLKRNMEAADLKSIKRPLFTITLAAGKESVVIDSDDAVPDEYVAVKVASTPDKKAIADFLKDLREKNAEVQKRIDAGEDAEHELQAEPEWARLQRGESSLRIK